MPSREVSSFGPAPAEDLARAAWMSASVFSFGRSATGDLDLARAAWMSASVFSFGLGRPLVSSGARPTVFFQEENASDSSAACLAEPV